MSAAFHLAMAYLFIWVGTGLGVLGILLLVLAGLGEWRANRGARR
jgi:hypothetical protein